MKTRCRRKRDPHAIWCSTVFMTNAGMPNATAGRDRANISDKPFASFREPDPVTQRSAKAVGRTKKMHFSLPKMDSPTVPRPDGRGIRGNPHRARGKLRNRRRVSQALRVGARSRPTPLRATVNSGERCCRLPLESIEESRATTTSSVVSHEPRVPVPGSTPAEGSWHGDISQIGR